MKSLSMTRLKHQPPEDTLFSGDLKWKASRWRDWNVNLSHATKGCWLPWNEKPLDDEIETYINTSKSAAAALEMKSLSMTRLKHLIVFRNHQDCITWNEKPLDDEIETNKHTTCDDVPVRLKWKASRWRDWNMQDNCPSRFPRAPEMKSILITRLKPTMHCRIQSCQQPEMKSISIARLKPDMRKIVRNLLPSWNEKHLDCEIETCQRVRW